jgi:hypothetical protein
MHIETAEMFVVKNATKKGANAPLNLFYGFYILLFKLIHPPPLWTSLNPLESNMDLADPLRMPEAQQVIITLSFGILLRFC